MPLTLNCDPLAVQCDRAAEWLHEFHINQGFVPLA